MPRKLRERNFLRRTMRLDRLEDRSVPTVFTVTSVGDAGAGTLRQAILDANAAVGPDTITFAIGTGPVSIAVATQLEEITDGVLIDGTSQPGFAGTPIVELTGGAPRPAATVYESTHRM